MRNKFFFFVVLIFCGLLLAQATRPVVRIDIQPDGCFSPCNSDNIRFRFTVVDMDGYPLPTTPFIPVVFGGDPGFRFNAKSLGVGGTYDTTFSCAGRNNGAYRWEIRYYNAGADQYQPCNYEGASPTNFTISCSTTDTCSGVTPPRPTGFTVEPGSSNGEIRLSWDRSRCATTYNIQRTRPTPRSWSISGTSAVDSGLERGVLYCYKVQACNGPSLCSGFTAEICDTPRYFCIPPEFDTISANPPYAGIGEPISFHAVNVRGSEPLVYHWDFGDGSRSNLNNPSHIYTNMGEYVVSLYITNDCGTSDTVRISIFTGIRVCRGFNLLSVNDTISFDSIRTMPSGILLPYVYKYDCITRRYTITTTLYPFNGYWFFVFSEGIIIIP